MKKRPFLLKSCAGSSIKGDMNATNITTLFFHMGPGGNAQVEKRLLGAQNLNCDFWDQPPSLAAENSFGELIDSAQKKVEQLVQENGGPIHIKAHSFGGHIFHQLSLTCPENFLSCEFYGTGYDIPAGFFNLLTVMGHHSETPQVLQTQIKDYLKDHGQAKAADIWGYIGLIAQDPAFFKHYWPSAKLFTAFVEVASKTEPMNMLSFQCILNDFLSRYYAPENPPLSSWQGPLRIELGGKDPLISIEHETKIWQQIFPQAHIKVLKNSGHFIHLENSLNT